MSLLIAGVLMLGWAGQADAMAGMHAGIKGGVNIANQSTDGTEAADSRNGMAVGGWLQLPVAPMFSVQPEAYFSMKGDSEESGGVTASINMDYLEVPVLAKATFGAPGSPVSPSLFAGPSVGLNISSKAKVEGSGTSDGEFDVKDATKSTDFGFVFGGAVEFGNVGIDVRYSKGLTNVAEDSAGGEIKNNVISILGSLRFF
jgi:hypothetical protein